MNVYPVPIQLSFNWDQNCVVPENNHTPATEGIENSWGRGGGGGLRKNLFRGGGMDSFWNHTDPSMSIENYLGIST